MGQLFKFFTLLFLLFIVNACNEEPLPSPEKSGKEKPSAGELGIIIAQLEMVG